MNKSILISGGAGFVGSNLCIGLKRKYPDYTIIALDNLRRRGSELNLTRLRDHEIIFFHADIRNQEDLEDLPPFDFMIDASADPSVLAGINSPLMPLINTNLLGTVNCLELAKKRNAAFIFLSTSRVYPIDTLENADFVELDKRYAWTDNQLISGISSRGIQESFPISGSRSFYGSTKLASELLIDEFHALTGMKTVVNRCGVLSGPWQMGKIDQGVLVLWLARHYFSGSLKYIGFEGKGKQTRDVLHIDDLVRLIDWQINHIDQVNGETFNVGGGIDVSFSLLELTELCQDVTGNKIQILPELQTRTADIKIYITDNTKVTSTTGWSPTKSMKDLVQDTYNWMKENEKSLKQILN